MNREMVYQGIFTWLKERIGDAAVTYSRQVKMWSDVPDIEQPAVFVAQAGETQLTRASPAGWMLSVDVYIYTSSASDPGVIAATAMNQILDRITNALKPRLSFNETTQTLGGLVTDCKISGPIETDAGILGTQSVAILPLTMFIEEEHDE